MCASCFFSVCCGQLLRWSATERKAAVAAECATDALFQTAVPDVENTQIEADVPCACVILSLSLESKAAMTAMAANTGTASFSVSKKLLKKPWAK